MRRLFAAAVVCLGAAAWVLLLDRTPQSVSHPAAPAAQGVALPSPAASATRPPPLPTVPPTAPPAPKLNPTATAIPPTQPAADAELALTMGFASAAAVFQQVLSVNLALPSPTPTPPPQIHIVQRGETLYRIAQRYGVALDWLIAANQIANPGRILVGQALIIPTGAPAAAASLPAPIYPTPALAVGRAVTPAVHFAAAVYPTPHLGAPPSAVNGIPLEQIIVLPEHVRLNIRSIYLTGQALGRNPAAFSKLGDSIIENPHFLARFDEAPTTYNLGDFAYLQPVIDHFRGSFGREGAAVKRGLHSWSVFDPMWANRSRVLCAAGEDMLACELRLHNPSIWFIRIGTNDKGVPDAFDRNLRRIIEFCLMNGVIPIIGTKADRFEGPGNINNEIMRRAAADYAVPLWDFDIVAGTLPGRGTDADGVHLKAFYAHDYTQPVAFQRGHGVHNLTALIMLDQVWRAATSGF